MAPRISSVFVVCVGRRKFATHTIQPIPRVHPSAPQRRRSARRLRNCCCLCLLEPTRRRCQSPKSAVDRSVLQASLRAYLDILVRHPNVVRVSRQIFWRGHDCELDGLLISKSLVCPSPHRSDLLDGCDTIVGDENLNHRRSAFFHIPIRPLCKVCSRL